MLQEIRKMRFPGKKRDLIVTMDDATSEHYSMFFVDEEGTASSFQGVRDVILQRGLFSSFYTDRGSHYWYTSKEGRKVSKAQLTQFGRAMKSLGIQIIATYSPEARGRSERAFETHQDRLVKELALQGITDMDAANYYLAHVYLPAFNAEFMQQAPEEGSAFVPWKGDNLDDILCEQNERTISGDNCVSFDGMKLQVPADRYRCHYVRVRVRVHRYPDGALAIFHGPRKLADYDQQGTIIDLKKAAWRSYPQPPPALPFKSCGRLAMDNSLLRKIIEESARPPISSCSQKKLTLKSRKSGQVYLLLTLSKKQLDGYRNLRIL